MALLSLLQPALGSQVAPVLKPDAFAHHIVHFNSMDDESLTNVVSNANSWAWLRANIPFFECPDQEVEEIYYFRWWSLRKHLCRTPQGFVFTEFLTRPTPISSALGHQINEGRWLRNTRYLDDYILYWLRGSGDQPQSNLHKYSSWLPYAVYQRYLVAQDVKFLVSLLDPLVRDYQQWERERRLDNGLFWQYDVRDGMEESISGSRTNRNLRPTINSYMFGNARAIAAIARLAGKLGLAQAYEVKAADLKRLVQTDLWDPSTSFFKVRLENGQFSNAREEIGFIPWYFELPDPGYEAAWAQFSDPAGFHAAYGLTTAERRHPQFRSHGCCQCEWDGAVWPFATCQTLTALGNVLHDYTQSVVNSRDYFQAFLTYVRCQRFEGKPYIGEYLDETTGQWLKGKQERSRYYNHSTFADLLITGIMGLRPRGDDVVEVYPLLPQGVWDWACVDGIRYHDRVLTILWDKDGQHYGRGSGLSLLADGKTIGHAERLQRVTGRLP